MKLFGTDGIRGKWGVPPLTESALRGLGAALREFFGDGPVFFVRDTRQSGPELVEALAAGLGGEVIDLGVLPTPAISAILADGKGVGGLSITASHNPWQDNGVKVLLSSGRKPSLEQEARLEVQGNSSTWNWGATLRVRRVTTGLDDYLRILQDEVRGLWLHDFKIAVDCANGAAYQTAPQILERLGAKVHAINVEPNGENINRGCGAVHPEHLAKVVVEQGCDLGICLDGDADRCVLVDRNGRILDGDAILWLLRGPQGVVGTVMSNAALERRLAEEDIPFVRAGVGDRQVAEVLRTKRWGLGGEPSGHVLVPGGFPTGDGMLTALKCLERSQDITKDLEDWEPDPSSLVNVRVSSKPPLEEISGLAQAEKEALADGGTRVLLRYSGTEPKLRVLVEARDQGTAERLAAGLADFVVAAIARI
ncbi:MAG: phosphoglucosamine mutase [Cognaticolwellia sp.]|jgi:phosphoglucosamine mutase